MTINENPQFGTKINNVRKLLISLKYPYMFTNAGWEWTSSCPTHLAPNQPGSSSIAGVTEASESLGKF